MQARYGSAWWHRTQQGSALACDRVAVAEPVVLLLAYVDLGEDASEGMMASFQQRESPCKGGSMRVLDLSQLLPGPYCSLILAAHGAEVIKVERPGGGDPMRYVPPLSPGGGDSHVFCALNRGKKSLTLNLKTADGRAIFLRLVEGADVLLEGFRPGVMERLSLGFDVLTQMNPRLVYCSLSGYGQAGPYCAQAGHDLNYVGLAGILDLGGPRDGPPAMPGVPIADLAGALWAAVGILWALLERERTGRGQRVDASLLGGALSCLPLAVARQMGQQPMARGASDLTGGLVCYQVYQTADGQYMTLSALEQPFWQAFCQAVGREDLLAQQLAPASAGEPAYEELCALFRERTRAEWVEALAGVDACCEPVYSVEEAMASPVVRALDMLDEESVLPPVRLAGHTRRQAPPAPLLGEHTPTILSELGYSAGEIARLGADQIV
jgi:alpha-methylacyl-CoA racemase